MKSILIVDDDVEFTQVLSRIVEDIGHEPSISHSVKDAKEWLDLNRFDHVLIDFMLPDGSGLHVLEHINQMPNTPQVTFVTGNPSAKKTISSLAGPNVSYLLKPIQREDLESLLNPPKTRKTKTQKIDLHYGCLIGESEPMKKLYNMIERVSKTDANVLVMGESGAGKELVAQGIHNAAEPEGRLVATNCGAFTNELIASELFGHEKGAFTGAVAQKAGVFERANKGTLFLDEVTEMSLEVQTNLLRVLETNKITRVGGTKETPVACRVISATNRDMDSIAQDKVLREDIYFRLAVFPIEVPPLRAHKEDIELLVNAFLIQLNEEHEQNYQVNQEQLALMHAYDWPGNIRELKHYVHRAFIMSEPGAKYLTLPDKIESPFSNKPQNTMGVSAGRTIEEVEKELIFATLEKVNGNKSQAAEMLGVSTKTLYNRLNAYEEEVL